MKKLIILLIISNLFILSCSKDDEKNLTSIPKQEQTNVTSYRIYDITKHYWTLEILKGSSTTLPPNPTTLTFEADNTGIVRSGCYSMKFKYSYTEKYGFIQIFGSNPVKIRGCASLAITPLQQTYFNTIKDTRFAIPFETNRSANLSFYGQSSTKTRIAFFKGKYKY